MNSQYDTAQICLNGHVVNALSRLDSAANQDHCGKCGEKTMTACANCNAQVRGPRLPSPDDVFYVASPYDVPAHCYQCGTPFPWTQRRLDAAHALADEFDALTPEEREQLKGTLPSLFVDTPRTVVAEFTFKRLMLKVGKAGSDAMRRIVVDVVSEAVRKSLFGP
ncbi:MAG: DUF2321 domain-containing protein [Gammaproteobacteria bacterium]|nr:DUF2321 domain-containing protein [Gammaproteobacteria bacterium]